MPQQQTQIVDVQVRNFPSFTDPDRRLSSIENIISDIRNSIRSTNFSTNTNGVNSQSLNLITTPLGELVSGLNRIESILREGKTSSDKIHSDLERLNSNQDNIESKREREVIRNESQQISMTNALEHINATQERQLETLTSLNKIWENLSVKFTDNFNRVFTSWNTQITVLKEQGMGGTNGALLNRMTRTTMDSTEQLLGWNISIESAIKSTNSILSTGLSPRYLRENNKNLLMGLQGLGVNLQPSTIRQLGQAVFDATHIKELVGGWAELISPDTENALGKDTLSRFLESDEYKQMQTTIFRTGEYSRYDIDKQMQIAVREALQAGFLGEDALKIASVQTQARLGGALVTIPSNIQTMIGAAQLAGTFSGDLKNLSSDLSKAVQAYSTDVEVRNRVNQASTSLGANNDFFLLDNFQYNDGHTRRFASTEDIEQGQYEGALVRASKSVAGLLPVESVGGVSMNLTGDSNFVSDQFKALFSSGFKDLKSLMGSNTQTNLLRQIASNTAKSANVTESFSGGKGKLGKAVDTIGKYIGPVTLAAEAVATAGTAIYTLWKEKENSDKLSEESRGRAREYYAQELELQEKYSKALSEGNKELAARIKLQIEEKRELTNQELRQDINLREESSDRGVDLGVGIAGGVAGGLGGAALAAKGAMLGVSVGGVPGAIIGGLLGAGLGILGGSAISRAITSNVDPSEEDYTRGVAERRRRLAEGSYESGGLITKEQLALVGEGDKPEAVIPLTDPEKASSVLSQASSLSGVDPQVSDMLESARKPTIADSIIEYAKSLVGVPYHPSKDYMNNPNRGVVCNQLVEYAYNKSGVPLKSRSVHYHLSSGDWSLTESPQPGFVIFSNYGFKERYGLSDYGHLGIIGHNGERVHASSVKGQVVIDPDFERSLSYEKSKRWTSKGKKSYIFGFLRGVDYGLGSTSIPEVPVSVSADIEDNSEYSPKELGSNGFDESLLFSLSTLRARDFRLKSLNRSLFSNLLDLKKKSQDNIIPLLEINNPFNVMGIGGAPRQYFSLSSGVQDFVSSVESSSDKLTSMTYKQQMKHLKEKNYITEQEYNALSNRMDNRLADSIDNLNRTVQESNRIANQNRVVPSTTFSQRRY